MSLKELLIGNRLHKMPARKLRGILYDIDQRIYASQNRLDELSREYESGVENAENLQGRMLENAIQQLALLDQQIEGESRVYSKYQMEKNVLSQFITEKGIREEGSRDIPLIVTGVFTKLIEKLRKENQEEFTEMKRTVDLLQDYDRGASVILGNRTMEKISTLIGQIQNARSKGDDFLYKAKHEELREALKQRS